MNTFILYIIPISILFLSINIHFGYSSPNNQDYELNDVIYGKSYQYWASKWWGWHISIPSLEHPRENYNTERCGIAQNGPVWFLPDAISKTQIERDCHIPADKSIIVQVIGGECDYGEPHLNNDIDVITCVNRGIDNSHVRAYLDGKEIKDFQDKRIGHYWFNITVPEDNIYQEDPGTYRALVDGWFLFLKPLSVGKHELIIQGDHTSIGPYGLPTEEDHHQNLKYNLYIE